MARMSMSPNPSSLSNYITDRLNILSKAENQRKENDDYFPDIRRALSSRGYEIDIESSVEDGISITDDELSSIAQSISIISQMKDGRKKKVNKKNHIQEDFQWLDKGEDFVNLLLVYTILDIHAI